METVKIFWTGGWDSTFRIIQLSRKNIKIQPYYMKGRRKSTLLELKAMKKIRLAVLKLDSTKAIFLPTIIFKRSEIPVDEIITASYEKVKHRFGNQYEALSRFAKGREYIELSIEKDDCTPLFGPLEWMTVDEGKNVMDREKSNEDLLNLFGSFSFPLMKVTKLDMYRMAHEWGCEHIMSITWFCHTPINALPCGTCNPCRHVIRGGLGKRLSTKSRRRYHTRIFKDKVKKILGR